MPSNPNATWTAIEVQEHPAARSISDDDQCAECTHCAYAPGDLSLCKIQAEDADYQSPGVSNEDGYVVSCERFEQIAASGDNWVEEA